MHHWEKSCSLDSHIDLARTGSWFITVLGVIWQWWLLCCWNSFARETWKSLFFPWKNTHSKDNRNLCSKNGHFHIWDWNWLYPTGALAKKTIFVDRGKNETLVIPWLAVPQVVWRPKQLPVHTEFWSPSTGNPIGKQPELGLHTERFASLSPESIDLSWSFLICRELQCLGLSPKTFGGTSGLCLVARCGLHVWSPVPELNRPRNHASCNELQLFDHPCSLKLQDFQVWSDCWESFLALELSDVDC